MRTEEVERARAREREHFYQRDSAYPAFINFKLFDNELWLPGKTGCLVTMSLTLRVLSSGVATGGPGWGCDPPNKKLVIFQMDVIY